MAMDKNERLRLFKKVPKLEDEHLPTLLERLEFLDIQIQERKKMLYRAFVEVGQAEYFADLNDTQANQTAEASVSQNVTQIKGLKYELASLELVRKKLIGSVTLSEIDNFYQSKLGTNYPLPVDWLEKRSVQKAVSLS